MENIIIDDAIQLVKYYPNYKASLKWYLDKGVCKQVDNRDEVYDLDLLKRMYQYLNKNGYLFYIKYKNRLCGDVCLQFNGDVAIVISKEYQSRHIGRKVMQGMIELAKGKGYKQLHAQIYSFNKQSQNMFLSAGFTRVDAENFVINLG